MTSDNCILIASHDRYESLAKFTLIQIDAYWLHHPPIFFCGLTGKELKCSLRTRRHVVDWLGIMIDATKDLMERGFKSVYLILDDHPPTGKCQHDILNVTLPKLLGNLEATNISLFGFGQGRQVDGVVTIHHGCEIERLPNGYLWRYSLHPGLWSLKSLDQLLTRLDKVLLTIESRSPWSFERVGADGQVNVGNQSDGSSYRIGSSSAKKGSKDNMLAAVYRLCGGVSRSTAGLVSGPDGWRRVSHYFDFAYHYYGGCYPMFWRGVMEGGRENREFRRFCRYFLKTELSANISKSLPAD